MVEFKGKHRRKGCWVAILPLVGVLGAFIVAASAAVLRVLG